MILLPTVPPDRRESCSGVRFKAIAEAEGKLRFGRLVEIAAHVKAVVSVARVGEECVIVVRLSCSEPGRRYNWMNFCEMGSMRSAGITLPGNCVLPVPSGFPVAGS